MQGLDVELKRQVSQAAERDVFSGVVLLAQGDDVALSLACNKACRRFAVPNEPYTRFDIASVVKVFTATAIGQLVERGLIVLDAPIAAYVPGLPPILGERVTVHHLLTHTSGLRSVFDVEGGGPAKEDVWTIGQILAHLPDPPLQFEPGERWEYSNEGYVLLGAVIEAVTGGPYAEYFREHIFAPAGMGDTGPYARDEEVPRLAYGYLRAGASDQREDTPCWKSARRDYPGWQAACCLYSTAPDLLRFARALRRGELVSAPQVALLTGKKVPTGRRPGEHYAYGFFTEDPGGVRIFGHGGMVPGFQAWFDIFPVLDYTVVVLANFEHPAAFDVGWFMRTRLTGVSPPVLT